MFNSELSIIVACNPALLLSQWLHLLCSLLHEYCTLIITHKCNLYACELAKINNVIANKKQNIASYVSIVYHHARAWHNNSEAAE